MPALTTLLLAPALAPLTGLDPQGCAVRDLARALQQMGWSVTVVVAIDAEADTNRVGLARRLEPMSLGEDKLIVHEGNVEGDIRLLAFGNANPEGGALAPSTCLAAALELGDEMPEVLQLWSETREASTVKLSTVKLSPPSKLLIHLGDSDSPQDLEAADLLLLRSQVEVKKKLRDKESPLAPHADKLRGLLPGFDDREWNPARDSVLSKRMDPPNALVKSEAKAALRSELGLKDADLPLIGIVSKFKLQRALAEQLLALDVQFAAVGAGPDIEALANRAPQKVACPRALSEYQDRQLRHRIVAAADFILMPSEAEPVSQLFPCRYGSAVIAGKEGEFAERLANFDLRSRTGSGFLYGTTDELLNAVRQAIAVYEAGPEAREALIERCLQLDLSWNTTALRLDELVATL